MVVVLSSSHGINMQMSSRLNEVGKGWGRRARVTSGQADVYEGVREEERDGEKRGQVRSGSPESRVKEGDVARRGRGRGKGGRGRDLGIMNFKQIEGNRFVGSISCVRLF